MGILANIFTWWNGATFGTWLFTKRKGSKVGEDHQGNVYFEGGKDPNGLTRRWVIYKGANDASRVPAEWHGWLHHSIEGAPESFTVYTKDKRCAVEKKHAWTWEKHRSAVLAQRTPTLAA